MRAPTHIDFYNGDLVADCGATGDVTWDYQGIVTGTVKFNANATGGSLDYTNSNGMWLHGVVTSYRQIDDHTAVFAGTITGGSPDYTDNHPGTDYFFAKVVDGTPAATAIRSRCSRTKAPPPTPAATTTCPWGRGSSPAATWSSTNHPSHQSWINGGASRPRCRLGRGRSGRIALTTRAVAT